MKAKFLITTLLLVTVTAVSAQKKGKKMKLKSETDSVSYALGVSFAENMKLNNFSEINLEAVTSAMNHVFSGDSSQVQVTIEDANKLVQEFFKKKAGEKAEEAKKEGVEFLEKNKDKDGVITLPSGLQYMVLEEGTGDKPTKESTVTTHYTGTLINGKVFDSSVKRGEPAQFPVGGVIPGWTEALQLMSVGSKWRLFIPSELGYGARGAGAQIKPHSVLIFDIELISIDS